MFASSPDRSAFAQSDALLQTWQLSPHYEFATLAGGCFWCLQAPYEQQQGVIGTLAGYAGGKRSFPTYEHVCTGVSGHREVVQVCFDPSQITYNNILDIFWLQIDPIDAGGQFSDRGFQYTTAIYVHSSAQQNVAEQSKRALQSTLKPGTMVATTIETFTTFFPAEDYHQQFYKKQPNEYYRYKLLSGRGH